MTFSYRFVQDEKATLSALKARPPRGGQAIKGTRAAALIKLLHCVMLGFGALGVGIALEYLASGQLRLSIWSCAIGIALLYVAVFGSIFVTLPMLARTAIAGQGEVEMTFDETGVVTRTAAFESHVKWQGVRGVTRTKHALVFWVGNNRPSVPLAVIADADALEQAVKTWIGDAA